MHGAAAAACTTAAGQSGLVVRLLLLVAAGAGGGHVRADVGDRSAAALYSVITLTRAAKVWATRTETGS